MKTIFNGFVQKQDIAIIQNFSRKMKTVIKILHESLN